MISSILTTRFLFDLRQNVNPTNVLQLTMSDSRIIEDFGANLDLNIPIGTAGALGPDDDAIDDSDSPMATDGESLTAGLKESSARDPEVEE
ncbi:uncharacterized protein LAESUDRAFT_808739, partial [Laetiporus sulphureus 93-53]